MPVHSVANPALDFLCVDGFIATLIDARALKTALELGVIDTLLRQPAISFEALGHALTIDRTGLRLLIQMLAANQVLSERQGRLRLTKEFQNALHFRDLLETKLDFAGLAMSDFADQFTEMVRQPGRAPLQGRLLELFDYHRCFDSSIESHQRTLAWMRLTSSLTRYEAKACMQLYDFRPHRRALDVGGNSGEFLLQLCKSHAQLRGTVFDLPLVCEIGMEHLLAEPEHERIGFIAADARKESLPSGYDLISFKSMLHDWPEPEALAFLAKAARVLAPGGTLLVFERAPLLPQVSPPFAMLPILLFFRSYRQPSVYTATLDGLGLQDITVQTITLDTPFFLITARKPL